jgi:hypothetical protein
MMMLESRREAWMLAGGILGLLYTLEGRGIPTVSEAVSSN